MGYARREHEIIVDLLEHMDHGRLARTKCFFGGGTAIVLKYGEYRRSLDIDFLCSDGDGYREIRNDIVSQGATALFPSEARVARDPRLDQYGIRLQLVYRGQPVKFEIVREVRISVTGDLDAVLKVPTLSLEDMFAEKLRANADRCYDRAVGYRDALDLGKLVQGHGEIPKPSIEKAEAAYGADIQRKIEWTLNRLRDIGELTDAARKFDMDPDDARAAIARLREAALAAWPSSSLEQPNAGTDTP